MSSPLDLPYGNDTSANMSSSTSPQPSFIVTQFAPSNAPRFWNAINAFVFLWSFLLSIELGSSNKISALERLEDVRYYLVWNFGTTLIWASEVTLNCLAAKSSSQHSSSWPKENVQLLIELILALYFTGDSIYMLRKWKQQGEDLDGQLVDTVLNSLAYLYLLLKDRDVLWGNKQVSSAARSREDYEMIV